MCLEFLCSWCHEDEDGPEHDRPQTPAGFAPKNSKEHIKENNHPSKNIEPPLKPARSEPLINAYPHANPAKDEEYPSKPLSEQSVNGSEIRKEEFDHAYTARGEPPPRPRWGSSKGPENMLKGEYYTNPARYEPPNVSVPHVGNNTVLTAPVHQPNLRRGAESNVLRTNGHNYPTVNYNSGTRNRNMQKVVKEEDEEEEEEEELPKVAPVKNQRYY